MFRQLSKLLLLSFVAAIVLSGCVSLDVVPIGVPDLTGPISFCKLIQDGPDEGKLVITVENQGATAAPASITTLEFNPGGSLQLPTPDIPVRGSVDLPALSIPAAYFNPDCDFKINVDANGQLNELNEGNNTTDGNCLG